MYKKRLFGYSKRQVDTLIKQIESDFQTEEEILKAKIKKLEEDCELLKNENEADRIKLAKARNNYQFFMKAINNLLIRKSK
jgi:cell division septum initiation protein DivIVA